MTWATDADNATLNILTMFNHAPEFHQSKPPSTVKVTKGFRRAFAADEVEHINSFGDRGAEITVDAATMGGIHPVKLDRFTVTIDGEVENYTVGRVNQIPGFSGKLLMFRCLCRGG